MKNLHIIPTDKPSRLYKHLGRELKYTSKYFEQIGLLCINQNIYITNESDIKENDYVIVSCSEVNIEEVRIVTGYYNEQFLFDDKSQIHMDYCKKIVLTTDQDLIADGVQAIDDDFLEWFVKNPTCEYVEIESNYRVKSGTIEEHKQGVAGYEYYEYKIIIPQEELKQVPIENDEFIQWFVKNSSCEDVEVNINSFGECHMEGDDCSCYDTADQSLCKLYYPNYKIIIPIEEPKQELLENDEFCYYSGLPSPTAYKENMNPFELPNVLPDDIFNKSLEEDAEKEYPKLIVKNPSCNGYNEPNHIDINEECRNSFMEGVKSDEAKEYWFDVFKKNKEKWNKVTEDTPPSNVELLVKSPNGIIHLSRWRESYNIFGCQAKSESIVGWKWKKI